MDLNSYRNKLGFLELDKLKPEKSEDGEVLGFNGAILLKFSDSEEIIFKNVYGLDYYKAYSALVVAEIAKQLGLPFAEYDIGEYGGYRGLISWNFLEKGEVLILGSEILSNANIEYDNNYGNNLKDILEALKLYIHDEKTVLKIIEDMTINNYMLDIAIAEEDRHANNWGIIFNPKESTYRCVNIFDTDSLARTACGKGAILSMLKNIMLPDRTVDINKIKEHSEYSKQKLLYDQIKSPISSDFALFCRDNIELAKKGFGIISKIDIKSAFENVEAKIGVELPEEYKIWLEIMVSYRINLMKETIYNVEILKDTPGLNDCPKI